MKKYCKLFILAAALMGGLSLNSCIDLDPIDYSDINPSNFPQTETDVESMVNSCYYSVRSSWFDGLFSTSERGVTVVNDLTITERVCFRRQFRQQATGAFRHVLIQLAIVVRHGIQ